MAEVVTKLDEFIAEADKHGGQLEEQSLRWVYDGINTGTISPAEFERIATYLFDIGWDLGEAFSIRRASSDTGRV